ncbi:MAG: LLM class flavin-dependent oxidoreductase, partial [Rhodospirillales bacterium]|nr:LLM class flavin-dependent oxidoreductase [Rhodospirillales bacterium]
AFLAAVTRHIRLGTGIKQLAARTPANAAMCAGTVDALAGGGRFIAGLGVSGPQIVEGWYGEPWGRPYYRLKDYVAIMRKIFRREEPVTHDGKEIRLPYTGEGAAGVGKPLKSILHMNPGIPIFLATGNESTVKLTAEVADGWLPMGFVPGAMEEYRPWLEEGFRRAGNGKEMIRRGFSEAADRIQELYLAHRKDEAIAAVPDEWVDMKSLVGPAARIKERFRAWEDSGATGLTVRSRQPEAVAVMAEAARLNRAAA